MGPHCVFAERTHREAQHTMRNSCLSKFNGHVNRVSTLRKRTAGPSRANPPDAYANPPAAQANPNEPTWGPRSGAPDQAGPLPAYPPSPYPLPPGGEGAVSPTPPSPLPRLHRTGYHLEVAVLDVGLAVPCTRNPL